MMRAGFKILRWINFLERAFEGKGLKMVKYSRVPANTDKTAMAKGADLRVHFKNTYETADVLRGKDLEWAKEFLQAVLEKKRAVPFRVHNKAVARCSQAKEFNTTQGRWPAKSVKIILSLLQNAESNAVTKGLDADKLFISHIAVQQAAKGRRRTYRAHGRINPYCSSPAHVELFLAERKEHVARPDDKKLVKFTKRQLAFKRLTVGGDKA